MERPNFLTDEHLEYLDELRESGIVNMFGAVPYIQDEFGFDEDEAMLILKYWMKSFGSRKRDNLA